LEYQKGSDHVDKDINGMIPENIQPAEPIVESERQPGQGSRIKRVPNSAHVRDISDCGVLGNKGIIVGYKIPVERIGIQKKTKQQEDNERQEGFLIRCSQR
jgi:hypothetical protein